MSPAFQSLQDLLPADGGEPRQKALQAEASLEVTKRERTRTRVPRKWRRTGHNGGSRTITEAILLSCLNFDTFVEFERCYSDRIDSGTSSARGVDCRGIDERTNPSPPRPENVAAAPAATACRKRNPRLGVKRSGSKIVALRDRLAGRQREAGFAARSGGGVHQGKRSPVRLGDLPAQH